VTRIRTRPGPEHEESAGTCALVIALPHTLSDNKRRIYSCRRRKVETRSYEKHRGELSSYTQFGSTPHHAKYSMAAWTACALALLTIVLAAAVNAFPEQPTTFAVNRRSK